MQRRLKREAMQWQSPAPSPCTQRINICWDMSEQRIVTEGWPIGERNELVRIRIRIQIYADANGQRQECTHIFIFVFYTFSINNALLGYIAISFGLAIHSWGASMPRYLSPAAHFFFFSRADLAWPFVLFHSLGKIINYFFLKHTLFIRISGTNVQKRIRRI